MWWPFKKKDKEFDLNKHSAHTNLKKWQKQIDKMPSYEMRQIAQLNLNLEKERREQENKKV